MSTNNKNIDLSEYSEYFKSLNESGGMANRESLNNRHERIRLALDLRIIRRYARGPMLLDFPIGTGRLYPSLQPEYDVYGYDICQLYVEWAKQQNPERAVCFKVNALETIADRTQFDTITTFRVMNRVADLERAIANLASILKPGGRLLFNFLEDAPQRGELPAIFGRLGLRLVDIVPYDWLAKGRDISSGRRRVRSALLKILERGWLPDRFWVWLDGTLPLPLFAMYIVERVTDELPR